MARSRYTLMIAVLAFTAIPVLAQTVTGTLQGTVTERSGNALPGVTVTARNMDTGEERVSHTSEAGFYVISYVPVGKYRVTAALAGLGEQTKAGVDVGLNFTRTVNFALAPQMAETVPVTAPQPLLVTVNGAIKK